ncbi:MAG TPA: hypothetical protein VKX17_02520 [Planctomycetota bacterium]|nr:hypothetical protein [Planctomycetota bacterium]
MKKLLLWAFPCAVLLLTGCSGDGGGGGYSYSEPVYTDHGYASESGQNYSTSTQNGPPNNNYPVNYNATIRTTCSDGSCQQCQQCQQGR